MSAIIIAFANSIKYLLNFIIFNISFSVFWRFAYLRHYLITFSFYFYQESRTILNKIRFLAFFLNVLTGSAHLLALIFDASNGIDLIYHDASPLFWLEQFLNTFFHPPAQCMESGREAVKVVERVAEAAKTAAAALERSEKSINNITITFFQATFGTSAATIAIKGPIIKSASPVVKGAIIVTAVSYGYISTPE